MDILAEARRLAGVATIFVWVGWFFVIYAIVAGIFWWISLTSSAAFNFLTALGASLQRDRRTDLPGPDRRRHGPLPPTVRPLGRNARGRVMSVRNEALRLLLIGTVFVWVGWFAVIYAIVAGILWWIDLAQLQSVNWFEALGSSLAAIGGPIFLALIVAGMGHFLRIFAMWAASSTESIDMAVGAGEPLV